MLYNCLLRPLALLKGDLHGPNAEGSHVPNGAIVLAGVQRLRGGEGQSEQLCHGLEEAARCPETLLQHALKAKEAENTEKQGTMTFTFENSPQYGVC